MGRMENPKAFFSEERWEESKNLFSSFQVSFGPMFFCDVRLALGSIFQLRVQLGFSLQGKAAPKASPTEMEIGLLQPARTWGAPGETLKPWAKMGNMR